MTRVAVNGAEAANATMTLDIGDIPPGGFGEVVWRIEAEEAGRFVDFSSDYRMLNYLGEALAPSLRGINTTFAPPSDPFEYGCLTDAFSVSGYVRDDNDIPLPGITVASDSGRTAVTNADGYYVLPGLVTGTYTIVPTQTGYTFLPETGAANVPPSVTDLNFTGSSGPVNVEIFDAQGNPVTALTTNDEGWPTPNPLTVQVTLNCPADGPDCENTFDLTMEDPNAPPLTPRKTRFYLYDNDLDSDGIAVNCGDFPSGSEFSYEYYYAPCTRQGYFNMYLDAGETKTMQWFVWVQPSEMADLRITAKWAEPFGTIYIDSKTVPIEQAQIHPIVFIHGLGATVPPTDSQGWYTNSTDPGWRFQMVTNIGTKYTNLFETLEKMGYEQRRTLFFYNYNWLYNVVEDASAKLRDEKLTLAAQIIQDEDNGVPWVDTTEGVKFDFVTHSTGALVARAYIQTDHWNNDVRRLVTVAGPHRGVSKIYKGWEGIDPDLGPLSPFLRYFWIPKLAKEEGYKGYTTCIYIPIPYFPYLHKVCKWLLTDEESYKFTHNPYHGTTIMPQFLPDRTPDDTIFLQDVIDGEPAVYDGEPYPYDHQANPLWESESVVTDLCSTERDHTMIVCDPYQDYLGFSTTYYGLNEHDKARLLTERLGGIDNLAIVYGDGLQMLESFAVGPPSQTAPYWRNGKPVEELKGPGDGTVQKISGYPQAVWTDENGILINIPKDVETIFGLGDSNLPNIFNVQGIHDERVATNPDIDEGKLEHVPIIGYTETQDAVIRALTRIELPLGFIEEYGPKEAEEDQDTYEETVAEQLLITVLSPVELTLTDIQGRRLGYDPTTGEDLFEIPNGVYLREEETDHKSLLIFSPEAGDMTLTLTGMDTGAYTLLGFFGDEQAVANLFIMTGTTTLGQAEILTVTVPNTSTEVLSPPSVQAGSDLFIHKGQSLAFAGQFNDINPDDSHITAWDFGDGGTATDTLTPTHTFTRSGMFTVTLTVTDSVGFAVRDSLLVTVSPVFHEDNGQVVMEAEHFTRHTAYGRQSWFTQTILTGYTGTAYLSAFPDTDRLFTTVYTNTSLELQYGIHFTTTGTYYAWMRGHTPNGAGDSVYFGLENQNGSPATILTGFIPRAWDWANSDAQNGVAVVEIAEPGVYTFHLWQREDGLRLDRILLTTDNSYNPVGNGPSESEIK